LPIANKQKQKNMNATTIRNILIGYENQLAVATSKTEIEWLVGQINQAKIALATMATYTN
jgi:hypothetical protein